MNACNTPEGVRTSDLGIGEFLDANRYLVNVVPGSIPAVEVVVYLAVGRIGRCELCVAYRRSDDGGDEAHGSTRHTEATVTVPRTTLPCLAAGDGRGGIRTTRDLSVPTRRVVLYQAERPFHAEPTVAAGGNRDDD